MFLAHENSIKPGEVLPLKQFNNKRSLSNGDGEYYMLSNVCPHQTSIICTKSSKDIIQCQYHGWEFNSKGNPVSSGVTSHYCTNDKNLQTFPVYKWSNMIFSCEIPFKEKIDLSNLVLIEKRTDAVDATIENIMNVFLDVDHIPVVHKGVYEAVGFDTVTANNVEWSFYENGSIQRVGDNALWVAIYPNTMIEWQAGAMFITVALSCFDVLVYKYRPLSMSDYEWELNNNAWETAWKQDQLQASSIIGKPAKNNLEESKTHYKEWLKNYDRSTL